MAPLLDLILASALAGGPGLPLHQWGARPAAIVAPAPEATPLEAFVTEVHLVPSDGDLLVRFTFDRPVRQAMSAKGGRPVSGRLRATLYWDVDDDTRTGLHLGDKDQRTGAERRLEVGVVALGEDPDEKRPARALVVAALYGLTAGSGEDVLWRTDDDALPPALAWRDGWVELRVPRRVLAGQLSGRVVLAQLGNAYVGRVTP